MSVQKDVEIITQSAKQARHPVAVLSEAAVFATLTVGLYGIVALVLARATLRQAVKTQKKRRGRRIARQAASAAAISGYRSPPRSWP